MFKTKDNDAFVADIKHMETKLRTAGHIKKPSIVDLLSQGRQ